MLLKVSHILWSFVILSLTVFASCQPKEQSPLIPDEYRSWNTTTDIVLDYPIPGHENHFRVIYINAVGEQVQPTQKNNRIVYDYPEGTIVVKEIYDGLEPPADGEEPVLLNAMIKAPQHAESRGGWIWIVKNYATKEERVIDYEFCVDCHANANERHPYGDENPDEEFRDYVYFPPSK
jgi:hypothetical protein